MDCTSSIHTIEALESIISDNVTLKHKIASFSSLPFHKMTLSLKSLSETENRILFQTGILSQKIFIPKKSTFDLDRYKLYFANGAVQFLHRLLEKRLVRHDVKLLVETNTNALVLKPIMYEHRQTLDYMLLSKLADPDVTDSLGCPMFLDGWREMSSDGMDLIRVHKLLTLGAKGLGVNSHGDNLLHFLASRKLPWASLKSVLKLFMRREHLQILVSQRNYDGLSPFHLLVRHAFKHDMCTDSELIIELTDFMLELGADINAPIYPSGLTILHLIILNYNKGLGGIYPGLWAQHMTSHLRILPDQSGITPLALAMYYRRKPLLDFILNKITLCVQDVLSRHSVIIPYQDQLIPFYEKHHRKALLLRIKHGLNSTTCDGVERLPENIVPFQDKNLVDDGLVLTLENIRVYSSLKSPWYLDYMSVQMEALLIRTVNRRLHSSTLYYFLNCYLDSLNSDFELPTDYVTEHNYMSDFNFQLSKHLCRIARALGHLRFDYSLNDFIDKFLEFLYKKMFPLLDVKLSPSDINAASPGYIDHFIQDVVYQINIVLYMWYSQLLDTDRTQAKAIVTAVWKRVQNSPNSLLSVFNMFVAAVVSMRVKICIEIKLNPIDILSLFKEMGSDMNSRMMPSCCTSLSWIVTTDKLGKKQSHQLLLKLLELGVYLYARDENGQNVIDLAKKSNVQLYKTWGAGLGIFPKPLATICSECIIDKGIPMNTIGKCRYLVDFIKLHGLPKMWNPHEYVASMKTPLAYECAASIYVGDEL